jgi:hypothetical protein
MRKKLWIVNNFSLILCLILVAGLQSLLPARAAEVAAKGLHRVDFRLEKASCATCIRKVRTALRASIGVVACEIAFRKPYGAVVIFEPAKITVNKMKKVAMEADPNHHVELVDAVEKPINSVPTLLLPMYTTLKKSL